MASAQGVKAGQAFVSILADDSKLQVGLRKAQAHLKSFASFAATIGAGLSSFGGAIVGAALVAAKGFADAGSKLNDMSARTSVAVESLSELGYAAEQTGSNIDEVEKAVKAMQKQITNAEMAMKKLGEKGALDPLSEDGRNATTALRSVGLTLDDLRGKSPEEQFLEVATALNAINDDSLRAGAALQILGKGGTALLPMVKDMAALRREARMLGIVMSAEDAAAADELGDALDKLGAIGKAAWNQIGAAIAPALTSMLSGMASTGRSLIDFIRNHKTLTITVVATASAITALGSGILGLAAIFYTTATAIKAFTQTVVILTTAMKLLSAVPSSAFMFSLASGTGFVIGKMILLAGVVFSVAAGMVILGAAIGGILGYKLGTWLYDNCAAYRAYSDAVGNATLKTLQFIGVLDDAEDDARKLDEFGKNLTDKAQKKLEQGAQKYGASVADLYAAASELGYGAGMLIDNMGAAGVKSLEEFMKKAKKNVSPTDAGSARESLGATRLEGDNDVVTTEGKLAAMRKQFSAERITDVQKEIDKIREETVEYKKLLAQLQEAAQVRGDSTKAAEYGGLLASADDLGKERERAAMNKQLATVQERMASIQEEAARSRRSALENEISDIQKLGAEYNELLKQAAELARAKGDTAAADKFGAMQTKNVQDTANHEAEARRKASEETAKAKADYALQLNDVFAKADKDDAKKREDDGIDHALEKDKGAGLDMLNKLIRDAMTRAAQAREQTEARISSAGADGKIDEEEQKGIDSGIESARTARARQAELEAKARAALESVATVPALEIRGTAASFGSAAGLAVGAQTGEQQRQQELVNATKDTAEYTRRTFEQLRDSEANTYR